MARPPGAGVAARIGPWLTGIGLAGLLLGPLLGPGDLLNLDLVLVDPIPIPAGVWGLGPELPRRVPFMAPVAWAGALAGSWIATRLLLVGLITLATAGMHRVATGLPEPVRYGLAVAYGAGPFLVTRLGIGHLGIALATALLPWALPHLLMPSRSRRATAMAAAALGLAGVTGGSYVALGLVTGLLAERPPWRCALSVATIGLVTQLPWLVPGAIVYSQGVDPSNSVLFGARLVGPLDFFRLVVGHGFWQDRYQVGFGRTDALLIGVALIALGAYGAKRLPAPWRGRGAVLAVVILAVVVAGALPGLDELVADAVAVPALAPLREAHRLLPVVLLWLLLAAGHGTVRLAAVVDRAWRPAVLAVPLALGVALSGPGAWGLGDDLVPFELDQDWEEVRAAVEGESGAVVALPWSQYLSVDEFDGRRVHHPAPFVLQADVIISSDPRLGPPARERTDEREPLVDDLVARLRDGAPVAADLADLGVRWVLLLTTRNTPDYAALNEDPGLDVRVEGEDLVLYEVDGSRGPVITPSGDVAIDWTVRPMGSVDAPEGGSWTGTGADGWLRGIQPVSSDGPGRLSLPQGDGILWYWPSVLVLVADGMVIGLVAVLLLKMRHLRVGRDYGVGSPQEESCP